MNDTNRHILQVLSNASSKDTLEVLEYLDTQVKTHDIVSILPDIWKWIYSLPENSRDDQSIHAKILELAKSSLEYHFSDCDLLRITFYRLVTKQPRHCDDGKGISIPAILDPSFDLKMDVLIALTQDGKSIRHVERDICRLLQEWMSYSPEIQEATGMVQRDTVVTKRLSSCLSLLSKLVKYLFVELLEEDFERVFMTTCSIALFCSDSEADITLLTDILTLFDSVIRYANLSRRIVSAFVIGFCHCFALGSCFGDTNTQIQELSQGIARILFGSHQSMLVLNILCQLLSEKDPTSFLPKEISSDMSSTKSVLGAINLLSWGFWGEQAMIPSQPHIFFPISQLLAVLRKRVSFDLDDLIVQASLDVLCKLLANREDALSLSSSDWLQVICLLQVSLNAISNREDLQIWLKETSGNPVTQESRSISYLHAFATKRVIEFSKESEFSISETSRLIMMLLEINQYLPDEILQFTVAQFGRAIKFEQYCSDALLHRFMDTFIFSANAPTNIRVEASKLWIEFSDSLLTERSAKLVNTLSNRLVEHIVDEKDGRVFEVILDWMCEEMISISLSEADHQQHCESLLNRVILSAFSLHGSPDQILPAFFQDVKHQTGPYEADEVVNNRLSSVIPRLTDLYTKSLKSGRFHLAKLVSGCMIKILKIPGVIAPSHRVTILQFFAKDVFFSNKLSVETMNTEVYFPTLCTILGEEPHYEVLKAAFENAQNHVETPACFQNYPNVLSDLQKLGCDLVYNEQGGRKLTDLPNNVRKSDIYGWIVRLLTAILSHNHLLNRTQIEDIISSLLLGLNRWPAIAKSCLFGLTICLLEVPSIMVRYVTSVLLKISQTTSTSLAVPNLEFLSVLARVPELYINFTEADYKRVFGIALQYVRFSSGSSGANVSSISQYTTQLAYHVLSSWFMCLKMSERRRYVSFIIHYLQPNAPSNASSATTSTETKSSEADELTELVLDMMALNTYADCGPRPRDQSHIRLSKSSKNVTKSWIVGNTLVSIVFDGTGNVGNGSVVVHRPTGIVSFRVQLDNMLQSFGANSVSNLRSKMSDPLYEQPSHFSTLPSKAKKMGDSRHARSASMSSIIEDMGLQVSPSSSRIPPTLPYTPSEQDPGSGSRDDVSSLLKRSRSMSMTGRMMTGQQGVRSLTSSPAAGDSTALGIKESVQSLDPLFLFQQLSPRVDLQLSWEKHGMFSLPNDDAVVRAISVLDRTPVLDLHKVGILYVGDGQVEEKDILGNKNGSVFYNCFLRCLGKVFRLPNCTDVYTGGLDTSPSALDGKYGLCVSDDQKLAQVIFHVATMMPSYEHDPLFTSKKRHIGNDFVKIVWNESGLDFHLDQVPGQFNYVGIIIKPISSSSSPTYSHSTSTSDSSHVFHRALFHVSIHMRNDMPEITPLSDYPKLLTGSSLAAFVRQLAVHVNMLSQIVVQGPSGYISNAHERLRQLKRLRSRMDGSENSQRESSTTPS